MSLGFKGLSKGGAIIILESVQSLLSCLVPVFCLAEVSLFCFD